MAVGIERRKNWEIIQQWRRSKSTGASDVKERSDGVREVAKIINGRINGRHSLVPFTMTYNKQRSRRPTGFKTDSIAPVEQDSFSLYSELWKSVLRLWDTENYIRRTSLMRRINNARKYFNRVEVLYRYIGFDEAAEEFQAMFPVRVKFYKNGFFK